MFLYTSKTLLDRRRKKKAGRGGEGSIAGRREEGEKAPVCRGKNSSPFSYTPSENEKREKGGGDLIKNRKEMSRNVLA